MIKRDLGASDVYDFPTVFKFGVGYEITQLEAASLLLSALLGKSKFGS